MLGSEFSRTQTGYRLPRGRSCEGGPCESKSRGVEQCVGSVFDSAVCTQRFRDWAAFLGLSPPLPSFAIVSRRIVSSRVIAGEVSEDSSDEGEVGLQKLANDHGAPSVWLPCGRQRILLL